MLVDGREISFLSEQITLEHGGKRLTAFRGFIMTFDAVDGRAAPSAEIQEGQQVVVSIAPRERLIRGADMRNPALFAPVEKAPGRSVISYL